MKPTMFSRCVFIVLLSLVLASHKRKHGKNGTKHKELFLDWSYDDETQWPGHKCQQGGPRQSPINIDTEDVIVDHQNSLIKYGPLTFTGYMGVLLTGINNGLTIQLSTDGEYSIHPVLSGGPLQHKYRLEQLHFHWISEHAVDGKKYPMEIHFVHVRTDLTVGHALHTKDGLAIVSVFGNVETDLSEEEEERVNEIMDLIPQLLVSGNRVSGALLNLKKLLNPSDNYYSYLGSLTSPECNEVVIWIIFATPITFSDVQYKMFTEVGSARRNFRSLQPLRRHTVYSPPPASVWRTPIFVSAITGFFSDVSTFFRNITDFVKRKMLKIQK